MSYLLKMVAAASSLRINLDKNQDVEGLPNIMLSWSTSFASWIRLNRISPCRKVQLFRPSNVSLIPINIKTPQSLPLFC